MGNFPKATQLIISDWEEQRQANAGFNRDAVPALERMGLGRWVRQLNTEREDVSERHLGAGSSWTEMEEASAPGPVCPGAWCRVQNGVVHRSLRRRPRERRRPAPLESGRHRTCVESGTDKEDPNKFLERTEKVDEDEPFSAEVLLSE